MALIEGQVLPKLASHSQGCHSTCPAGSTWEMGRSKSGASAIPHKESATSPGHQCDAIGVFSI